ncbi:MAG: A24 family peptidase, partial [Akkermansiaceae bacterium]
LIAMVLFTILVVITFIDAEHQLIPIWWTSIGSLIALLTALIPPELLDLSGELFSGKEVSGWTGMIASAKGWVAGFVGLAIVVILGKLAFGRFKLEFDEPEDWKLQEGYEESSQLHFVIGEQAFSWDDLFYRDSDVLIIEGQGFRINGKGKGGKQMEIRREEFRIGESRFKIEDIKSLEGKATKATVPREAMGMGDPHLLGMIGAFLGWPAVIYVVFSGSLYALVAALVARVGFGRPLPFGPFLALGALSWIFGGWTLWNWYFDGIRERF